MCWLSHMRRREPAESDTSASDCCQLLLALTCECRDAVFDCPRVMHRAELWPAHSAELRALEIFGGQSLVVIFLRTLRIEL